MEAIKHISAVLAALALSSSACSGGAADPGEGAPPSKRFTVATYNINWGNVDLAAIAKTIAGSGADLVALQEANARSERYIRRALAKVYPHMKFRGHDGRYVAGGFGFLSKGPIRDLKWVPPKHGLFGAWLSTVRLAGRDVRFVSLHLRPVFDVPDGGLAALLRAFASLEKDHMNEMTLIWKHVPRTGPIIVLGDFNSISTTSAPGFLRGKGLRDSFASVTKGADRHVTWKWTEKGKTWRFRLDYIFHTRDMRTVKSALSGTDASDHLMVRSEIEWLPKGRVAGDRTGDAESAPDE